MSGSLQTYRGPALIPEPHRRSRLPGGLKYEVWAHLREPLEIALRIGAQVMLIDCVDVCGGSCAPRSAVPP
jgi:hypothetical protein